LNSLTKIEQVFSEKSVYFENYYYKFIRHPALLPLKDKKRFQKILKKTSMD